MVVLYGQSGLDAARMGEPVLRQRVVVMRNCNLVLQALSDDEKREADDN